METLGYCFNLETLDLVGSRGIDDNGARMLVAASVTVAG